MTDMMTVIGGIVLLPYKWRGKTYKTVSGLCSAVMKVHPHSGVSFDKAVMYVRNRSTNQEVRYAVERTTEANIIADQPL